MTKVKSEKGGKFRHLEVFITYCIVFFTNEKSNIFNDRNLLNFYFITYTVYREITVRVHKMNVVLKKWLVRLMGRFGGPRHLGRYRIIE